MNLDKITLRRGDHPSREDGVCAMEAVAWLAGEEHTDHPACCSRVIAAFVRAWNDGLPTNADRDRLLKPLLPLMIGTATGEADDFKRSYMAMDWIVRTYLPAWLDLTKTLTPHAAKLRGLPVIDGPSTLIEAEEILAAARIATWNVAKHAIVTRDEEVGEASALDAAWDATWYASWGVTGVTDWMAAKEAAWDAAKHAINAAPRAKVRPTIKMLQQSAVELLKRMCAVGRN